MTAADVALISTVPAGDAMAPSREPSTIARTVSVTELLAMDAPTAMLTVPPIASAAAPASPLTCTVSSACTVTGPTVASVTPVTSASTRFATVLVTAEPAPVNVTPAVPPKMAALIPYAVPVMFASSRAVRVTPPGATTGASSVAWTVSVIWLLAYAAPIVISAPALVTSRPAPSPLRVMPPATLRVRMTAAANELSRTPVAVVTAAPPVIAVVTVSWMSLMAMETPSAKPTAGGPRARISDTAPASASMVPAPNAPRSTCRATVMPPLISAWTVLLMVLLATLPEPTSEKPPPVEPPESPPPMPSASTVIEPPEVAMAARSASARTVERSVCAVIVLPISLTATAAPRVISIPPLLPVRKIDAPPASPWMPELLVAVIRTVPAAVTEASSTTASTTLWTELMATAPAPRNRRNSPAEPLAPAPPPATTRVSMDDCEVAVTDTSPVAVTEAEAIRARTVLWMLFLATEAPNATATELLSRW